MVDFGGYAMPLQYAGIRAEHLAVRHRAGLFDVSHMGEVLVLGERAEAAVQTLVANDVSRLRPGGCLYAVMCTPQGGIVDDVIVMRRPEGDGFLVVVNAACRTKDVAWMRDHLVAGAEVVDIGDECGLLALQGPAALGVAAALSDVDLSGLRPFRAVDATLAGVRAPLSIVSRTGYTGEDGLEIYIDAARVPRLWDALLEAGAPAGLVPAGLGARDTLRLEAGLRLYGQDMDETVDPFSAGLGWTVKLGKGDFIGAAALGELAARGAPKATVGLALEGRSIARHGNPVIASGEPVGDVRSGGFGFSVGHGIATALVDRAHADRATYDIDIRGTSVPARAVPLPFYRRSAP